MLTARDIAQRLASDAAGICRELLPNGKRQGSEWCIGSIQGEEGQSLRVHLIGEKAGIWCDFATGESGDLLDLWAAVQGIGIGDAIRQAKARLGLTDIGDGTFQRQPRKQYSKPDPAAFALLDTGGPVAEHLRRRGLSDRILQRAEVAQTGTGKGAAMVFRYLCPGDSGMQHEHTKFIALERDSNGKKRCWTSKETRPVLYGWHLIGDKARKVVLVEGEIDCLTLAQLGIPCLSVPMGGGNKQDEWLAHEFDRLARFDEIYLALDNDPSGHEARNMILDRLGTHRCRIVDWPEQTKDANACLEAGWQRDDFLRCLRAARVIAPEELTPAEDYRQDVKDLFANMGRNPIQHLRLPWLSPTVAPLEFAPGELTVWTGMNGHGKTTVLNQAMNYAIGLDERVCIASMEIAAAQTLHNMVRQATALKTPTNGYIDAVFDVYADKLWIFSVVGKSRTARMLEVFEYARARFGIQQFVVDSLLMLDVGYEDWSRQVEVVQELVDFARSSNTHIHLVAHSRKAGGDREPGRGDVRGAGGITDLASNVIIVWANDEKQVDPSITGPDAMIIVDKNRRHGWRGRRPLDFDPDSLQLTGGDWPRPMGFVTYSAPAGQQASAAPYAGTGQGGMP